MFTVAGSPSKNDMFIKFSGAGWLFPFYFGVAKHLQGKINLNHVKVGGVSAGSVVAVMLLMGVDFKQILEEIIQDYEDMKYNPFLIKECLQRILRCYIPETTSIFKGRLVVGVSFFDMWKRLWRSDVIDDFKDKETCIDALKASCHIPIVSGLLPYYVNGFGYYDGELAEFSLNDVKTEKIEVTIAHRPGTINPGIHLPEIWKYYPLEPFILRQLFRLGFLRSKEYFGDMTVVDEEELAAIKDMVSFFAKGSHITYTNRLWRTVMLLFPYKSFVALFGMVTLGVWIKRKKRNKPREITIY